MKISAKLLVVYLFFMYIIVPIHEYGHYLVAQFYGLEVVYVKWFSHPWEINDLPHVQLAQPVMGTTLFAFMFSGLALSALTVTTVYLIARHFKWNEALLKILFPFCLITAVSDFGSGIIGFVIAFMSFGLALFMLSPVIKEETIHEEMKKWVS